VLARLKGGDGDGAVQVVRQENFNRIDVGIPDEVERIGVRLARPPLRSSPLYDLGLAIAHGGDLGLGVIEVAEDLEIGDPPAADDSDAHALEGRGPAVVDGHGLWLMAYGVWHMAYGE